MKQLKLPKVRIPVSRRPTSYHNPKTVYIRHKSKKQLVKEAEEALSQLGGFSKWLGTQTHWSPPTERDLILLDVRQEKV